MLLVGIWLALIPNGGGYFARTWYPAAIATVLVLAVAIAGGRRLLPEARWARLALLLLAALVVWSFVSTAWAGSHADAWEASNQLLLVLATAWCMAIQPAGARGLTALFGIWSVGVAVLCGERLLAAAGGAETLVGFLDPQTLRWNAPMAYPNAASALPALAVLPALALAARRSVPVPVRALLLGAAVFLAEFALLPQSRGVAVGLAAALPVLVVLSADRVRLLVALAVVTGLTLVAASSVLEVGNVAMTGRPAGGALDDALPVVAITTVLGILAGAVLALLDRRVHVPPPSPAATRRLTATAVAVGVLVIAGAAVTYGDRAVDWGRSTWTTAGPDVQEGGNRLLSLSPEERPDYARAAVDIFADHPVTGAGSGNFGREYDARRTLEKPSRYAHNIWLRVLSELGAVGVLLFVAMLVALVGAALTIVRRVGAGPERTAVAAAFAAGVYLLAHGSLDWLDEFGAVIAPVSGFVFGAAALMARVPGQEVVWWERLRDRRGGLPPSVRRPVAAAGGVAALCIALAVLVPPWLSARYLERVRQGGTAAQLRADLQRAADLNPFSAEPAIGQGRLELRLKRYEAARRAFSDSLTREDTWGAQLELGILDAAERRWADAEQRVEHASRLSAHEPVIAAARRAIQGRKALDPSTFTRTFVEKRERSLGT